MDDQDPFSPLWDNTSQNNPATFDLDIAPSRTQQSQGLQQPGAHVGKYSYGGRTHQIASDAPPQHAASYTPQISPNASTTRIPSFSGPGGASSSAPRDSRVGRGRQGQQQTHPVPQLETSGLAQDYSHLAAEWSPEASVIPGRRSSRSGSHAAQQPRAEYNQSPTQPSFINGRPRRSDSQHYDPNSPPAQPLEDSHMSVDASGSQQRCIIPGCQYPAYYNVAEEEQMEYCGHGHELQAIETGFVKPCAMCKGRPRRTGENVCGPVCRERARLAFRVQGSYYGVSVTRLEPQTRAR
jgi:hypothetical protein